MPITSAPLTLRPTLCFMKEQTISRLTVSLSKMQSPQLQHTYTHVPYDLQVANIFTKALNKLLMVDSPALTREIEIEREGAIKAPEDYHIAEGHTLQYISCTL